MKLIHYSTPPTIGKAVLTLNSQGYIGINIWDGENYRSIDCSDTPKKYEKQPFFTNAIYNPQKDGISTNIAFWIENELDIYKR